MMQKLFFAGLLFIACIGLPSSIYFSQSNHNTVAHAFVGKMITPTPKPNTLGIMQEATGDANNDHLLNILDYNSLLDYKEQAMMNHFIRELKTQSEN